MDWDPTLLVSGHVTPCLGGTLRLAFDPDTEPASLVGTTFDLFDWNGTLPAGEQFSEVAVPSQTHWDLSRLYSTGEVTLRAVPEPASLSVLALGGLAVLRRRLR